MVEALSLEVIQWRTRTLKNTRELGFSKSGKNDEKETHCRCCSTSDISILVHR